MAWLLGFLAAGAVKGAGDGIVAEAKAKREAAIAELANSRLETREAKDREFRSTEGQLDREARMGEAKTDREFRAGEGKLDREAAAAARETADRETLTGADGTTLLRTGDTVRQVKDADGKPVKTLSKSNDAPADAKIVEYLVSKGIAKTPEDAYKLVTQSKGSEVTKAEIVKMAEDATKTEFDGAIGVSPEKVQAARERNFTRLNEMFNPPKPPSRPADTSDADLIEQGKQAIAAGADPAVVAARLKTYGVNLETKPAAPAEGTTTAKTGRTG